MQEHPNDNDDFTSDLAQFAPPSIAPAAPAAPVGREIESWRLAFNGDGGVYFGVWLVNILLTIVTIGLYTPWARRRTIRYFYGHTLLDDSPLEFTAGIRSMVFGFLLFVAIYIALELSGRTGQHVLYAAILIGGGLLAPFLWGSAMRFRLRHTRWRGLRLRFDPGWGEVYRASWPVFALAAIWLAVGFAVERMVPDSAPQTAPSSTQTQTLRARPAAALAVPEAAVQVAPSSAAQPPAASEPGAQARPGDNPPPDADTQTDADSEASAAPDEDADPDASANPDDADADADPSARPDDEDDFKLPPLPRSTWVAAGALLLGAMLLSMLCFVRLEFNYKRLLVLRSSIGAQPGRWAPRFGDFVRIWLATLGFFVVVMLALALLTGLVVLVVALVAGGMALLGSQRGSIQAIMIGIFAVFALWIAMFLSAAPAMAYREARMFQLMWNQIGVSHVARFKTDLRTASFVWLRVKNTLLNMLTGGFYQPFARVAEYKMKTESVTLHVKGGLDALVGSLGKEQKDGFGDAVADALGLDVIG